jgi:hypothetical protein
VIEFLLTEAAAAERIIAALDALDAADEDLEDGHDSEGDSAESGIADNGPIPRRLRFGAIQQSDFQAIRNTSRFNPA